MDFAKNPCSMKTQRCVNWKLGVLFVSWPAEGMPDYFDVKNRYNVQLEYCRLGVRATCNTSVYWEMASSYVARSHEEETKSV